MKYKSNGSLSFLLYFVIIFCLCSCKEHPRHMDRVPGTKQQAITWQNKLRSKLFSLLKIDDLVLNKSGIPLSPKKTAIKGFKGFIFSEWEINSTKKRRIKVVLTVPTNKKGPFPAIVVIGGHGCSRYSCYTDKFGHHSFARVLAENGYVTISARVSQHNTYENERTLMGERLWDLMRCVDFLMSLDGMVNPELIGCAGLSLGGEMAMWLGAMDKRINATVSSGFCTKMKHMKEKGHCACWDFPGLKETVDFSDIYSLIAPRALLCQNGLQEPDSQFPASIAREVIEKTRPTYSAFGKSDNLVFVVHKGKHEMDLPSLLTFFEKHLAR